MELSFVSISNYRSITDAYKLDLSNLTVFLGKNNEGKTNIIKAITLGMDILHNIAYYGKRRIMPKQQYDWRDDFPIILQNSKKIKKNLQELDLILGLQSKNLMIYQMLFLPTLMKHYQYILLLTRTTS